MRNVRRYEDNVFYDKEGNAIRYLIPGFFADGSCGTIHHLGNGTCIKIFNGEYFPEEDTMKTIIEHDFANFYKVYKMLYDKNGAFASYTMKYYEPEDVDFLTMPTEYTCDNFSGLATALTVLADERIRVVDFANYNTIINKNGITVIDVDAYIRDLESTTSAIKSYNLNELYYLMRGLYRSSLFDKHQDLHCSDEINELFSFDTSPSKVCKKLSRYKYPIDYLNSERSRKNCEL